MDTINFEEVKNNMLTVITIQLFFISFLIIMKAYASEVGFYGITNRIILSYTLTVAMYFISYGLFYFFYKKLQKEKNILKLINYIMTINVFALGVLIFTFVGTLRFSSILYLLFNLFFMISLVIVCICSSIIFATILFTVTIRKKKID